MPPAASYDHQCTCARRLRCTGAGTFELAMRAVVRAVNKRFGDSANQFTAQEQFMCELVPWKRQWLYDNVASTSDCCMYTDIAEITPPKETVHQPR